MKRLSLFLTLAVFVFPPASGLGRLVQPNGGAVVLGEVRGPQEVTLLFPSSAVPATSWLALPVDTRPSSLTLRWAGGQTTVTFPEVRLARVRYGLTVPKGLLSLTIRGRVGRDLVVDRTTSRPSSEHPWATLSGEGFRLDLPLWKVDGVAQVVVVRRGEGPWTARFSGEASKTLSLGPSVDEAVFSPAAWGFTPTRIEVTDAGVGEIGFRALGPEVDIPADPPSLLAWPREAWRSPRREWFSWLGTSVLVLVSGDYGVQDDYLKRLAFFVEKTGYRGRLVSDQEVAHLHAWNAHDYAAPDLARFFSLAQGTSFPLNDSEVELRDRLVAAGILVPTDQGWEPGTGALVGISLESPPALRSALFVHEGYHGLYFTSPTFREGVRTAWQGLSEGAREAFRTYLARSRYDPSDEGLMVNEFQAYVLQRSPRDWNSFFRGRVLAQVDEPASNHWASEYGAAAQQLNTLVGRLYGISSGEISAVRVY